MRKKLLEKVIRAWKLLVLLSDTERWRVGAWREDDIAVSRTVFSGLDLIGVVDLEVPFAHLGEDLWI